ncbi:MAG TPA: hypothetical protein VI316_08885 [Candidatus Dormibacteraeota bacterium]
MSSRNARRRRRAPHGALRPAAPPPTAAAPRSQPASRPPHDLVALYRQSTFVGRVPRLGLLLGLLCLDAFGLIRVTTGKQATLLSSVGTGLTLGFIVLSWLGYLRVIYVARREDPDSRRMNRGSLGALLGAPLGLGDPRATAYDRVVFWLTVAASAALLPLTFLRSS